MTEFEPTEQGHTERLIRENTSQPEFGEVTKVFEHTSTDDGSNFEVNVKLRDSNKERRRIPIATCPFNGGVAVPEVGDTVLINFRDDESSADGAPVVTGFVHNDVDRAPLGRPGIYRLRKGDLYVEMHPDGDWARIAKKSADDGTPSSVLEIDDSGSDAVVNIEAEGDVVVKSNSGKVVLGGDSGDPVARQGDPVEDGTGTQIGTISDGSANVDSA